ncbi:MAG TPA: hypothetical protein VFR29_05480 [Steroidobacteraceae bacterium]|nr:hypothetical protein [Steroidobacteraceae bacterium]
MRNIVLVLAALLALPACQVAQMRVAPELERLAAVPVSGANPRRWNAPLAFGPWRAELAHEGMKWDFALPLLGLTAGYSTQPYRVVASAGGNPIQAECHARAVTLSRKDLAVDPAFGKLPAFACAFQGRGAGSLRLNTTAMGQEAGTLDYGDTRWGLRSVHRFHGSSIPSGPPLGYEVMGGDRVVAAVETINQGRVWIDPAVSPRDQERLAVAIMVLLLYDPAVAE